jgi:hypothetical protein
MEDKFCPLTIGFWDGLSSEVEGGLFFRRKKREKVQARAKKTGLIPKGLALLREGRFNQLISRGVNLNDRWKLIGNYRGSEKRTTQIYPPSFPFDEVGFVGLKQTFMSLGEFLSKFGCYLRKTF